MTACAAPGEPTLVNHGHGAEVGLDPLCAIDGCWTLHGIDFRDHACWRRDPDGTWRGRWVRGTTRVALVLEEGTRLHLRFDTNGSVRDLVLALEKGTTHERCDANMSTEQACADGRPLFVFGDADTNVWLGADKRGTLLFGELDLVDSFERDPSSPVSPTCVSPVRDARDRGARAGAPG